MAFFTRQYVVKSNLRNTLLATIGVFFWILGSKKLEPLLKGACFNNTFHFCCLSASKVNCFSRSKTFVTKRIGEIKMEIRCKQLEKKLK